MDFYWGLKLLILDLGIYDSGINAFKGIPFATTPVGEFRWREPQPVKNWNGTLKATLKTAFGFIPVNLWAAIN